MNIESVRRTNVTREIRHGMRGESARRCIGKIESEGSPISGYLRQISDYHFAKLSEDSYSAFQEFNVTDDANSVNSPQGVDSQHRLSGWD